MAHQPKHVRHAWKRLPWVTRLAVLTAALLSLGGLFGGLASTASAAPHGISGTVVATNSSPDVTLNTSGLTSICGPLTWSLFQGDAGVSVTPLTGAPTTLAPSSSAPPVAAGNVIFKVTDSCDHTAFVVVPIVGSSSAVVSVATSPLSITPVLVQAGMVQSFVGGDTANQCLDNSNFNWTAGNLVQDWACGAAGGADQHLAYIQAGPVHRLAFVHGTSLWCVSDFGRTVAIESCTGGPGVQQVTHLRAGQYRFSNGLVLDVKGASTRSGTPVIGYIQKVAGIDNQLWSLPA